MTSHESVINPEYQEASEVNAITVVRLAIK